MTSQNPKKGHPGLDELERQVERSGFFAHSSLSRQAERINEIESFLYGLVDTLILKGIVDKEDFEETVRKVREEVIEKQEYLHAGVAVRGNELSENVFTPVNCEERMHICQAVCCKLNFALSVEEIESGKIRWDLGQPYFIRHNKNGYCCHVDGESKGCTIYADRPSVCRKYSCANDTRIWKDFEKMELNHEWIDENLQEQRVRLKAIYMIPEPTVQHQSKTP
jgi:Fe-S-cluster containining protein